MKRSNASSDDGFRVILQTGLLICVSVIGWRSDFETGVCGSVHIGWLVSFGCSTIRLRSESASIDSKLVFRRRMLGLSTRGARGELGHSDSSSISREKSGVGGVLRPIEEDGDDDGVTDNVSWNGMGYSPAEMRNACDGTCRWGLTGLTLVTVGEI